MRILPDSVLALLLGLMLLAARGTEAQAAPHRPQDEGRHDTPFESWVVLAHLTAPDGAERDLWVAFFTGAVSVARVSGVYVVLANGADGSYRVRQKLEMPLVGRVSHTRGSLRERYGSNELTRSPGGAYELSLNLDGFRLELSLTPRKPVTDLGEITVGRGRRQRHVASPRGEVVARVTEEGSTLPLRGLGVFQHLWGAAPEQEGVAEMFSLHLDDGSDALTMVNRSLPANNSLVLVDSAGVPRVLREFTVTADGVGDGSGLSGGWRFRADSADLDLRVMPRDQGVRVDFVGIPFRIVRAQVEGRSGGRKVTGQAYTTCGPRSAERLRPPAGTVAPAVAEPSSRRSIERPPAMQRAFRLPYGRRILLLFTRDKT